jgi:Glycosyl transferase family 2
MKLVMTLLVRDEADVLESWLEYHRAAGVDFVIATDHRSEDGTSEILEHYARAGYVHLLREDGDGIRQNEWVTTMARLAATEFGADWVINSDADEFWWPRAGSLKDVLATVPERYGVVRGAWRHFLPRPEELGPLFERMTVRLCMPAHPGEKRTIFHAHQKVAHRARPDVRIETGNHNAEGTGLEPLRGWYPLEVLHFSFRSLSQFERKTTQAYHAWGKNRVHGRSAYHVLAYEAWEAGRLDEYFGASVVDDDELRTGLAEGRLAVDTRLRDAVRALRAREPIMFGHPTPADDAKYAAEIASLIDIDGIVRAQQRVNALEKRLAGLRTLPRR